MGPRFRGDDERPLTSRKLFSDELEQRLDELLFASHSHRSAKSIADGLEKLSREQQERALHWTGVAAQSYAEVGYLVAALAPKALARLDPAGFEAWVLAGLDAYDRHAEQALGILLNGRKIEQSGFVRRVDHKLEIAALRIGDDQHRAEDAHIAHAMALGNLTDRLAVVCEGIGWLHRRKDTPSSINQKPPRPGHPASPSSRDRR